MDPSTDASAGRAATPASAELCARYRSIRRTTQAFAAPLSAEDCAIQSMPDASPVKWHRAHTSWFFETFVAEVPVRLRRSTFA